MPNLYRTSLKARRKAQPVPTESVRRSIALIFLSEYMPRLFKMNCGPGSNTTWFTAKSESIKSI